MENRPPVSARGTGRRVHPNSLAAYESVDLGRRQLEVLDAIADLHRGGRKPSDSNLAQFLSWPISWMTPRRGELVAAGRVECAGNKVGEHGRTVSCWRLVPHQIDLFPGAGP